MRERCARRYADADVYARCWHLYGIELMEDDDWRDKDGCRQRRYDASC